MQLHAHTCVLISVWFAYLLAWQWHLWQVFVLRIRPVAGIEMQRAQIANRPIPRTGHVPSCSFFPLAWCRILCQSSVRQRRGGWEREEELFAGAAAWPSQQSQQSLSLLDISALCCALSAGEMNRKRPHTATDRQTHTQTQVTQTEPHWALQEACGHFAPSYGCPSVYPSLFSYLLPSHCLARVSTLLCAAYLPWFALLVFRTH